MSDENLFIYKERKQKDEEQGKENKREKQNKEANAKKEEQEEIGEIKFKNGNIYKGEIVMGVPYGKGTMQYNNGNKYEGLWKAG